MVKTLHLLKHQFQIQLFGIEFSGVNAAGQKLMGLTMVELNDPVSKLDSLLNWYVPEEWSLAEAVSVPVMYAHVSSIMLICSAAALQ